MNKRVRLILSAAAGALFILLGGFVLTSESLKMVSGLCIGFGAAILALSIGSLLQSILISATEDEEMKRIEVNDERNVRIREKAGYMVSKVMNYMILAVILALGFMRADIFTILIVTSLLLVEGVLVVSFSIYYSKKL